MRTIVAAFVLLLVALLPASVFAQQPPASKTGGSVFSIPNTGATYLLLTNTSAAIRWVEMDTNSPTLLCIVLPQPLNPTNTITGPQNIGGGQIVTFTNKISWVSATNALAWAAAGNTTNGWAFMKLNPGQTYEFDNMNQFMGGVIGVSLGIGNATGVTGDMGR